MCSFEVTPLCVWRKRYNGCNERAFFHEWVRMCLLRKCGGIFALLAIIRLSSRVDSHVDSKPVILIAKVVSLWTNKRFLSAVNSHVGFQIGKFGTRVAALIAIIFLYIRLDKPVRLFSVCWRLQSIGITEKNKFIWPESFHEKWKWHATMMTMMMMIMMTGIFTYGTNTYRYSFRRYSVRTPWWG